jgi:hypothetical protein
MVDEPEGARPSLDKRPFLSKNRVELKMDTWIVISTSKGYDQFTADAVFLPHPGINIQKELNQFIVVDVPW